MSKFSRTSLQAQNPRVSPLSTNVQNNAVKYETQKTVLSPDVNVTIKAPQVNAYEDLSSNQTSKIFDYLKLLGFIPSPQISIRKSNSSKNPGRQYITDPICGGFICWVDDLKKPKAKAKNSDRERLQQLGWNLTDQDDIYIFESNSQKNPGRKKKNVISTNNNRQKIFF